MRVALIDPSLFTLPYDRALAEGLAAAGHDVTLHGRRPEPEDGSPGTIRIEPDFYRVANSRAMRRVPPPVRLAVKGLDHLASMLRLLARLRAAPPDVIHFQWLPLPAVDRHLLGRFSRLAPLVLTVHDTNPFNGDPAAAVQRLGFAHCLRRFDTLVAHTGQGRSRLIAHGLPPDRVALLPHGMLTPPSDAPPDPMTGPLTFVLFGKMKPYKGIDLLLEAFAALPPGLRAAARLHVVGKPYMDLAPLRAAAGRLGIADQLALEPRFVADAEVPTVFAPGAVAVFPYREIEASGVLPLAIAQGRPLVAARLGSFAETIADGVHGHLVAPGDIAGLTAALAHMIEDRAFAASCAAAVRGLYDDVPSWPEIGRRTAELYHRAAARTGRPRRLAQPESVHV